MIESSAMGVEETSPSWLELSKDWPTWAALCWNQSMKISQSITDLQLTVKGYISVATIHYLVRNTNDKMMSHFGSELWRDHAQFISSRSWRNVSIKAWAGQRFVNMTYELWHRGLLIRACFINIAVITVLKSINHSTKQSPNSNQSITEYKSINHRIQINQSPNTNQTINQSINQSHKGRCLILLLPDKR